MESHTMASENAEEQVSQAKPTLRDRNTVEDCERFCIVFRVHGNFILKIMWGFSSAGRAPALQAGGQRFDPANLHHMGR